MSWIEQEMNTTMLNGWIATKTPEEVAEELMKFQEYLHQVDKIFKAKRRKAKQQKKGTVKI